MAARIRRRSVLQAVGASLALTTLPAWIPGGAGRAPAARPRRFVAIGTFLGLYGPEFFPRGVGQGAELPRLLEPLEGLRGRFTVFSGLDHRAPNGHANWRNFLTGARVEGASFDQVLAARVGDATRLRSLELTCGNPSTNGKMCFTPDGVSLPLIGRPSQVYDRLFVTGARRDKLRSDLASSGAVLDLARADARRLERRLSGGDATKLSEYGTSVDDVERELQRQAAWLEGPGTRVDYELPAVDPIAPSLSLECERIQYDLMALALETDQTRVISLLLPGEGQVFTLDGQRMPTSYHGLSHHGHDPGRVEGYVRVGTEHTRNLARFLARLDAVELDDGRTLLDDTIVLFGSGMGDAHTHSNAELPILVAGGGLPHRGHVAIDRDDPDAPLLGSLFITLARRLGVELDGFAGTERSLDEVFPA